MTKIGFCSGIFPGPHRYSLFFDKLISQIWQMSEDRQIPINIVHLLPILDHALFGLLESLSPEDWQKPTIARKWAVKDIAAHLLDGNIRTLSMLRDDYYGEKADVDSYQGLLDFLNGLNADWVKAMKRLSPEVLVLLHKTTGPLCWQYFNQLKPFDKAGFAVNWAGENESKNWMHIAREYTEKWLHQQQIRDAVNKPGIMGREFFYPFINTFMMGLPHTYRHVAAEDKTTIRVTVTGETGGNWFLVRKSGNWLLQRENNHPLSASIDIDPDTAWRLFSKGLRTDEIKHKTTITGNLELAETALTMISVMA